jgi:sugar lactone lactonase YvrE
MDGTVYWDDAVLSPVLQSYRQSEGFKGVNDPTFDSKGRLYFTDQGQTGMHDPTGHVFRYDLDTTRLDCLIANGRAQMDSRSIPRRPFCSSR